MKTYTRTLRLSPARSTTYQRGDAFVRGLIETDTLAHIRQQWPLDLVLVTMDRQHGYYPICLVSKGEIVED